MRIFLALAFAVVLSGCFTPEQQAENRRRIEGLAPAIDGAGAGLTGSQNVPYLNLTWSEGLLALLTALGVTEGTRFTVRKVRKGTKAEIEEELEEEKNGKVA